MVMADKKWTTEVQMNKNSIEIKIFLKLTKKKNTPRRLIILEH